MDLISDHNSFDRGGKHNEKAVSLKLLALCLLMILIVGCQTQKVKAADLKVADTPVPTRIYQMFLQDEKATTVNRYIKQYHANYDKHFGKPSITAKRLNKQPKMKH